MKILRGISASRRTEMYRRLGLVYSQFNQRKFDKNSRGGGDWAPLKMSTVEKKATARGRSRAKGRGGRRKRRKFKYANPFLILKDKGHLRNALSIGKRGSMRKYTSNMAVVGMSSTARHKSSKMTYHELAVHHSKNGRSVFSMPDKPTERLMLGIVAMTIGKELSNLKMSF